MELFRNPKIDFLGVKSWCIGFSALLILASSFSIATRGLAFGIDFRGGADVQLKFREAPDVGALRASLSQAGFGGLTIQTFGAAADNEILIRLDPGGEGEESAAEERDIASDILQALRTSEEEATGRGKIDLNIAGEAEIRSALQDALGSDSSAAEAAAAITDARNQGGGLLTDQEAVTSLPGLSPDVSQWIRGKTVIGRFSIRSIDYVGPAVGGELRSKARWAVLLSLIFMLIYIAFRFKDTAYGVAAIVTLAHDVVIVLGFISFLGKEFDLSVLAAVLTVVGYSVNDTIVVFDRVRDNRRLHRQTDVEQIFNQSINQCLSRTILTSVSTLVVVLSIWLFGGSRLEPFAFALLIGTVSGTYSTIYIAAPTVAWWIHTAKRRAARA
jgi:preprotein translocase subunit SecF